MIRSGTVHPPKSSGLNFACPDTIVAVAVPAKKKTQIDQRDRMKGISLSSGKNAQLFKREEYVQLLTQDNKNVRMVAVTKSLA